MTTSLHAYLVQIAELTKPQNLDSIRQNADRIVSAQVQKYDESKGYPAGNGFVSKLDGKLLFSTQKGFKNFNIRTDSFEPNLSLPYSDTTRFIVAPSLQENGDFWFISMNEEKAQLHRLKSAGNQNYELSSQDFKHLLSEEPTINKIIADPEDRSIIATSYIGQSFK